LEHGAAVVHSDSKLPIVHFYSEVMVYYRVNRLRSSKRDVVKAVWRAIIGLSRRHAPVEI
jgi:hypothetical protein